MVGPRCGPSVRIRPLSFRAWKSRLLGSLGLGAGPIAWELVERMPHSVNQEFARVQHGAAPSAISIGAQFGIGSNRETPRRCAGSDVRPVITSATPCVAPRAGLHAHFNLFHHSCFREIGLGLSQNRLFHAVSSQQRNIGTVWSRVWLNRSDSVADVMKGLCRDLVRSPCARRHRVDAQTTRQRQIPALNQPRTARPRPPVKIGIEPACRHHRVPVSRDAPRSCATSVKASPRQIRSTNFR
jgi:hypothetical protein